MHDWNSFINNQFVTKIVDLGLKTMMMSPMDFYAAITPDCSTHGVGAGVHVNLTDVEVKEGKYYSDKSPLGKSILNEVGSQGLLSYSDFCFLLTLLSTPPRYIDTAFHLFDVTGDGNIEAKVNFCLKHFKPSIVNVRSLHM